MEERTEDALKKSLLVCRRKFSQSLSQCHPTQGLVTTLRKRGRMILRDCIRTRSAVL